MRMIDPRQDDGRRERKGLSARCTTSIYPVLNTYRIVAGIDRLAFQAFLPSAPPAWQRRHARVGDYEISPLQIERTTTIGRSIVLSSSPTTRFPSFPSASPAALLVFPIFSLFSFLPPFISRCKVHVSYAVKCMASAEYTPVWCHFWEILTRAGPVATMPDDIR